MNILEIKDITKDFKGLRALDGVNINIYQNGIFGLIGPNGSGKTTLANIISGFLPSTSGEITFKGSPITGLGPHEVAQKGIRRTFQIASLFSDLTVHDNIINGMYLKTTDNTIGSFFNTKRYRQQEQNLREKARDVLTFMELDRQADILAKYLPFGDQRKLEVAIALAADPELLILDEPAAGMNPTEQMRLINLIRLIRENNINVIIIDHNMKVIMNVCTWITVLDYGEKIAEGTPEEIAQNKDAIAVYLGK